MGEQVREIKFRGYCKSTKGWLYGNLVHYKEGFDMIYYQKPNESYMYGDVVDIKSIGQYTGLKDKNGKEIYEGDIVLTPFIDPIFGDLVGEELCVEREVVFHDGSFVVKVDNGYVYLECFTRGNNVVVIEKQ